ncbi:S8 family serine peptidase [Phaeobacter sp. HF9A]|uniref:S8 family serine peptidase n=1 Tax=Phaeobacter sp. HF9A TaxID=2721561 RepID=UPI001431E5E2|nr:S8 family serine peptidase [Phaeobacter sp. HF9A]NIZ13050.1 S8 family serine peptidase [Phaeobacter sp. HF9A]
MGQYETDLTVAGQENYPQYNALWHLQTLGVLDERNAPRGWSPMTPQKPTRVAVIDTSVAPQHPNLKDTINTELSIDFFSARLGSFPYRGELDTLDLDWDTNIADGLPHSVRLLTEFTDRLSNGSAAHHNKVQPCTQPDFSGHGTCIAGLVGARPCVAQRRLASGETQPLVLPYAGVDPMCEIVQLSTNFDPEPEGMILAFLYAELIQADVVLLPRTISDPSRIVPELGDIMLGNHSIKDLVRQIAATPAQDEMWSELAELIVNVSQKRPVVCAAGNANEEGAIYPANLATDHNGIISVGAVNAKGFPSSYSGRQGITVFAPSNDAKSFDATSVRLDERSADYEGIGVPASNENEKYSSFDVISTDVPGPAGYSGSVFAGPPRDGALQEYGSYFSRFGGTSAASALVAGFLSLGRTVAAYPCGSGSAAKSWLLSKSHQQADSDIPFQVPCWSGTPQFPDS